MNTEPDNGTDSPIDLMLIMCLGSLPLLLAVNGCSPARATGPTGSPGAAGDTGAHGPTLSSPLVPEIFG